MKKSRLPAPHPASPPFVPCRTPDLEPELDCEPEDDIDIDDARVGYASRQDQLNALHQREYSAWIASMTPQEVAGLKKLGLHEAHISYAVGGHSPSARGDIAESPRAATAAPDRLAPESEAATDSETRTPSATLEAISRLVSILLLSQNLRLDAFALAFAVNLDALNGIGTQGEVAKKLGLSATMVSRRTEHFRKLLDLPYSPHQKGKIARKAASASLLKDHWRHRKTKDSPPPHATPI